MNTPIASVMTLVLLNGSFGLVAAVIGFFVGQWLTKNRLENNASKEDTETTFANERSIMAAAQIRDLTTRVASDVGFHSSAVQQFSVDISNFQKDIHQVDSTAVLEAINRISNANGSLRSQLERAQERLKEQEKEIVSQQQAAMTDSLTSLPNRRAFDGELEKLDHQWKTRGNPYSLLIFDIDHFKSFNDTHGHLAGDEVLRSVGKTLRKIVKMMEMPCRYGGEEFSLLLQYPANSNAQATVERIRKAIEGLKVKFGKQSLSVTISLGLAEIRKDETTSNLIARADDALYASKKAGRNCASFHDGERSWPINAAPIPAPTKKQVLPEVRLLPTLTRIAGFREELERRVAESKRYNLALSVICIRIANYSNLCAEHNEEIVKVALDSVAQYLNGTIRDMDLLSWPGEGSFLVMLPGSTEKEASLVARRIETSLTQCVIPAGEAKIHLQIQIGVAESSAVDNANLLLAAVEVNLNSVPVTI